MYSFSPIATEVCHNGWFILAMLGASVVGVILLSIDEWYLSTGAKVAWILALIVGMNYVADWTAYEKTYANTKVEGTLVGFQAEGWNQQSGKSRADHHVTYVVYAVPEGNVMLTAATGQSYPQKAILYKN